MTDTTDGPVRLDESQFPVFLQRMRQHFGSIAAMARHYGVDKANLDKAVRGKRRPSPALLSRLGGTRKLVYEFPRVTNDSK